MHNIDFLPARYRERSTRRKTQVWRMTVVAVLGAAVGAAAIGQYVLQQAVAFEIETVAGSHAAAAARNTQFTRLQKQLQQAESNATLYAYLKHPWPRTRILHELTSAVPRSVVLQQLNVVSEVRPVTQSAISPRRRRRTAEQDNTSSLPPASRDFKLLQTRIDRSQVVARASGITSQASELHAFITRLNKSPLFVRAELTSLESVEGENPARLARFEIRVLVTSPHATPAAPAGPLRPRLEENSPAKPAAPPVTATILKPDEGRNYEENS